MVLTKNQTYWILRANMRMDKYVADAVTRSNDITKAMNEVEKYVNLETEKIMHNLEKISDMETAQKCLKANPSKSVLDNIKKAVKSMPNGEEKQKALTMLSSVAYKARIERLQRLYDNTLTQCKELYSVQYNATTDALEKACNDAYYRTIFDISKGAGYQIDFSMFQTSRIEQILKYKWSGRHYSERIWNNTEVLSRKLYETLLQGFMTGESIWKQSNKLNESFNVARYCAQRLIRTETNYVANQAELDAYRECGLERYKFVATLDARTSTICQEHDGEVYEMRKAIVGVNYPPMHPNCRSTTIQADYEISGERFARDANGKPIRVPNNMTYKEWENKYISGE